MIRDAVIRLAIAMTFAVVGHPAGGQESTSGPQDPTELDDRAAADPEMLERLRGLAAEHLDETPAWGEVPKREIGELELNQLRALGYAIP